MPRIARLVVLASALAAIAGCARHPAPPGLTLERMLFPDLVALNDDGITDAMHTPLHLQPPLSGGLLWLNERFGRAAADDDDRRLVDYYRAGVVEGALGALRRAPFESVASLPLPPEPAARSARAELLARVRSAAARFQYDVAFLLETATAEERGANPFALGYLGIVTAPLFPGTDLAASANAELCAVDVRTGIMLGCARGRAEASSRTLFIWQVDRARRRLVERTLRESVVAAAEDLLIQISARIASL